MSVPEVLRSGLMAFAWVSILSACVAQSARAAKGSADATERAIRPDPEVQRQLDQAIRALKRERREAPWVPGEVAKVLALARRNRDEFQNS